MTQVAKLFVVNGHSQAVRLPAAYRFEGTEVFIRQDPKTGDIILSRRPESWDGFFQAIKNHVAPANFLDKKERNQNVSHRDPFEGERE